jgi:hypothetical protein
MANLEAQGNKLFWVVGSTGPLSTVENTSASTAGTTVGGALIGQVVAFNGPSGSAAKVDVTNLASTGKEYLMGLRDEGDISMDVIYDPADVGHAQMFADRGSRTKRGWIIKVSTGGSTSGQKLGGQGFCTGFAVSGAVDDAVKATITIAITGAVGQSSLTTALWTAT